MKCPILLIAIFVTALPGCTHQQLTRSAVMTTSTVMDIQYRTVLMNLAMMSCHPEAIPSHSDLSDGVVQVNDRLGIGQAGGFTTFTGGSYGFGLDQWGPSGQRQVTEQWGADATTDPQRLTDLQDLYRTAMGLSPLPPPNAIAYLRRRQAEEGEKKNGGDNNEENRSYYEDDSSNGRNVDGDSQSWSLPPRDTIQYLPQVTPSSYLEASLSGPSATSSGGGGSTPSSPSSENGSSNGDSSRRVPIEILLSDVPPPGWFHLGCKKDVPKNACYVGCFGDRYAWVMPDGVPALSRFTVTVLSVVKFDPGEGGNSRGLAVTSS